MGKQHIIELNGKRYDALTGRIANELPTPSVKQAKATPKPVTAQNLDGFARPSRKKPIPVSPVKAHQTQHSQTLMRTTVQKPLAAKKHAHSAKPVIHQEVKRRQEHVAETTQQRLARAQTVPKSKLIQRFGGAVHDASLFGSPQKASKAGPPAENTAETGAKVSFSKALSSANSHLQPKLAKRKLRHKVAHHLRVSPTVISISGFTMAAVIIAGFFAYQNIPNLTMRIASARSGVHGELPGYLPAGFGQSGAISYKAGQISITYKSNSDNRSYKVTQSTSDWNSQSLHDNFVATKSQNYQTVENNGKTIYIYNGSDATWVDSGVWYRIDGNSRLSSDQLLSLASSM